ncbi:MAG: MOSC domain-containing protein [Planctomycetes bacterium]|nr:MOSC domain-containing protein [Planctomycetota bacterium]
MNNGEVVSIHLCHAAGAKATSVQQARALPGKGLEGDRYGLGTGSYSHKPGPSRELTLIEIEALEGLKRDDGLDLAPGDSRRNVVTRGVALNHLVDREFFVGEVRAKGIRLCEPCARLAELTDPKAHTGLIHRGGLRAQILNEGTIRVGDAVRPA